jgi:hypothetical protein
VGQDTHTTNKVLERGLSLQIPSNASVGANGSVLSEQCRSNSSEGGSRKNAEHAGKLDTHGDETLAPPNNALGNGGPVSKSR